jgi:hypothetical protein
LAGLQASVIHTTGIQEFPHLKDEKMQHFLLVKFSKWFKVSPRKYSFEQNGMGKKRRKTVLQKSHKFIVLALVSKVQDKSEFLGQIQNFLVLVTHILYNLFPLVISRTVTYF